MSEKTREVKIIQGKYLILKNYVTIPTISFYDMNAIRAS